jgi:hypothetical protein
MNEFLIQLYEYLLPKIVVVFIIFILGAATGAYWEEKKIKKEYHLE